jgi:O-antigen/teichoic acid export membrane protein
MFAFPVLSKIIKNVVSKPNKFYIEEIFKYAIPLLLSTLAFYGNTRIDVFLIGLFNVDQAEIGNYGMANALFSVFFIVAISASTAFFPLIAKYYKDQDNLRLNKLFSAMIFLVLVFTIPVFIIINFLSKPLINLVLPNFSETSLFLKYLSPLVILRSLGIICTSGFLIPTGNAKFVARLNLIAAICNICLDLFFIPRFGVLGSIIATLVAHGGIGVISMTLLFKYFDLKTDLRIFPFLISGFIMMLFIKASQMITTSENSIYIVFLAIISIIIFYIAFLLFYGVKEIKVFLNQEISTKFAKI